MSNLAFVVGVCLLHQLIRLDFDQKTVELTVWLTVYFPSAYLFYLIYSESVFFALFLGTVYLARKERWLSDTSPNVAVRPILKPGKVELNRASPLGGTGLFGKGQQGVGLGDRAQQGPFGREHRQTFAFMAGKTLENGG